MKHSVKVVLCNDGAILVPKEARYGTYFGFVPNADEYRLIEWETKEPIRVADYLVQGGTADGAPASVWFKATHPIGQQPEGAVLVPGSERDQV